MILFNIGEAEMAVGELTLRGCYLGSNVTYNVKKAGRAGLSHAKLLSTRPPISSYRLSEKCQRDGLVTFC
jgi:hypothetical protein